MNDKLDNTEKVIQQEKSELLQELRKIDSDIDIIEVENHTTYTDFVLTYQCVKFKNEIKAFLEERNQYKYSLISISYQFKIAEKDDKFPSISSDKLTFKIRRKAFIAFQRSLKLTICVQSLLLMLIGYSLWVIYKILY
jgi:hypothetical protein